MAIAELIMPKMGESIMEATILKWNKKVGEHIKLDETVLEIATDKVDSEIPSPFEGVLTEILYAVNDVVPIGSVIAKIETDAALVSATTTVTSIKEEVVEPPYIPPPVQPTPIPQPVYTVPEPMPFVPQQPVYSKPSNNKFFSPLVINIANSEGLSLSELERIPGTGAEGRVSKKDVLQYIADKRAGKIVAPVVQEPQVVYVPQPVPTYVEVPVAQPIVVSNTEIPQPFLGEQLVMPTTTYVEPVAPIVPTTVVEPIQEPAVTELPVAETTEAKIVEEPTVQAFVAVNTNPVAIPSNIEASKEIVREVEIVDETPTNIHVEETQPVANVTPSIEEISPVVSVQQPIEVKTEPVVVENVAAVAVAETKAPIVEKKATPIETASNVKATSVPQTLIQAVQQSVFIPTPIISGNVPLATLAEANSGKYSNPVSVAPSGNTEIIEMDRMRKLIAKHMVDSKHTSPHVTSFVEADVTNMVLWRERVKADFEKREDTKITFTPMFIECVVNVMKRFPLINSSIEGDKIIVKKDLNIGMATALPTGNLIVPVIKGADQLNIVGLSKAVNNLANAARNNQLKPDDTAGGTFTITNVGTFGSLMGTPIINQPQVAILAVGAIKKKPVVIESEEGDTIGIRHMMYLSLSYDHRVVDGSIGASFLTAVAKEFEKWDINRTWYQYV